MAARDGTGRIELCKGLLNSRLTLTADQVGADIVEFDTAAAAAGLVAAWVTVVDAAGMRYREEGAACPQYASRHTSRKFKLPA